METAPQDPVTTRPAKPDALAWVVRALTRPQATLGELEPGDTRLMIVLASLHGGLLMPAYFAAAQGDKFGLLFGNPITWVAVGVFVGLAWVQAIAFPAAVLSSLFGGRGDFASARTSVALSLLPIALLLIVYWLVRLAGQPELATLTFLFGWCIAAVWSLRNLRLCLMESYRLRRPAARASSTLSGVFGIWISLAIGLIPLVITLLMMAINGMYDRF